MSFGGRKIFKFYLVDRPTQRTYYLDAGGRVQTGLYTDLKYSPEGWIGSKVSFGRSSTYYGLNRTFTIPLKFVGDGATILRHLFYTGRGIEQPIALVILKWNPDTDVYELYYKGVIDLTNMKDSVAEGVTVNIMEGGIVQLLKAYENTVFQIPCDGSIPENVRVRLDGVLFRDTFRYQVINHDGISGAFVIPAVFTSNEGDNIGLLRGDPTAESVPDISYFSSSSNYILSSVSTINVRITGKIRLRRNSAGNVAFNLSAVSSDPLVIPIINEGYIFPGENEYFINSTVPLGQNRNLFIAFLSATGPFDIVSGELNLILDTRYRTTTAWGIRTPDLFKLIVEKINEASSSSLMTFNYKAVSEYLQQYTNLVETSGDSLRASNDAEYPQPVMIKTSLKDFFDSFNPVLNCALGNQAKPGELETLFIEEKGYVFDSSQVSIDLGEVADMQVSVATDYLFTDLKIGYANQQYDEKAGKYEYNTTAKWRSPFKSITSKEFNLVSKYRSDSYGVEYTRFNYGGRSASHNNSDNSIFILNVDNDHPEYDFFYARNESMINTLTGQSDTLFSLSNLTVGYFTSNQQFTRFTFEKNINTPQFRVALAFFGTITGSGTITATVYKNGNPLFSIAMSPGNISVANDVTGELFAQGDYLEVRYSSTGTAIAGFAFVSLEVTSEQIQVFPLLRQNYDNIDGLINPSTAFNIEALTPARMLQKHFNWIKSLMFNMVPDNIEFQDLDRNQNLSTTRQNNTITESASVPIGSMDTDPLFYPYIFEFKTKVPVTFMKLFTDVANGHIKFWYNGIEFYGFPLEMSQQPALNESQNWKLLCSPKTNLNNLINLDIDGLNYLHMAGYSAFVPYLCPVHFVPLGFTQSPRHHHKTMDQDWFKERVKNWIDSSDYFNPWQNNDIIGLQLQTNGLGPAQVQILDCSGNFLSTFEMNVVSTDAVKSPNVLYERNIPLTGLEEGIYYLLISVGTGQATVRFISEALFIKEDWPETLLFEYKHHSNKQATVFSTGYYPSFRVHGRIIRYEPGSKFAVYENQPADLEMLNGIAYDNYKLQIGFDSGVPDYAIRKLSRILLLSTSNIDGVGYTKNEEANWERVNFPGQPKEYWEIDIRNSQNRDGLTVSTDGEVDTNISIVYNIDASAFGENNGESNVIQVTEENQ